MNRVDVEAFLSRDWARVASAKDAHWQRIGAVAALRAADELHRHAKATNPLWPATEEREEDLEAHRTTSAILRRTPRLPDR